MAEDGFEFGIRARGWASATILPSEVKDLLWAQEQAADILPYQLPGARRPSLGTVYVRQDVGSDLDEAPVDQPSMSKLDERGQLIEAPAAPAVARLAVRPPSKPMRAVLDANEHLVITGGPGQGKSTLTLRLTAEIVATWSAGGGDEAPVAEPVLPLRIPARVLATHLGQSISQTLACSASAEYGRYLSGPLDPALFVSRVAGCRWLLLIDALDEVADGDARAGIVHTLAAWSAKDSYRVLLTTRPAEGGGLAPLQRAGAVRYELLPFDEEALRRFSIHWFEDDNQTRRFLSQIRSAHLFELVSVPLLATIAAIVFEQYGDRPLPGNKYALYELYLAFIRNSRSTSERFEQYCTDLIEHLGRMTLRSDVPLKTAVSEWAQTNQDAGAAEELVDHLMAVGPFVSRGGELTFLHHSFAEHVAATAEARDLPDVFDPRNAAFADLVHRAQPLKTGKFARTVLLHYTYLRSTQADSLLRWLHSETAEQHLLAARLLAWHLNASSAAIDDFLAAVRGWAMTTHHRAGLILARTSRATHHIGLASWLLDLFRDENAPWESRAEAAVALALRLRDPNMEEALTFLRDGVGNTSASSRRRLFAAEALAESGSGEREMAERGLRSVLDDSFASGFDRSSAAVVLSAFDGAAREYAIKVLQRIVSDADTSPGALVSVANGLAEISVESHERCRDVFLSVLCDKSHSTDGLAGAAVGLAALGGARAAAEILSDIITDPNLNLGVRSSAAAALASIGPRSRAEAADLLRAQVRSRADLRTFVTQLSRLSCTEEAAKQLRSVLDDRGAKSSEVIAAAGSLGALGPAFHDEAANYLWRVRPRCSRSELVLWFRKMTELNEPHRAEAIKVMRHSLTDLGVTPANRRAIAQVLITCAPEFHREAETELRNLASGERDAEVVAKAWSDLADLSPEFGELARTEMLMLARADAAGDQLLSLGLAFRSADEASRLAAAEVLLSALEDDSSLLRRRLQAAYGLLYLGDCFSRKAVGSVCVLVRQGVVQDLAYLARIFLSTGRGVRDSLARELLNILREENLDPFLAMPAVAALEILGYDAPMESLMRIVVSVDFEIDERARAAVMLARAEKDYLNLAADLVFRACGSMELESWRQAVERLARLGFDVQRRIRLMIADRDRRRDEVVAAACLLGVEGISFLREQLEESYADFQTISNIYQKILEIVGPPMLQEVIDAHLAVLRAPDELMGVKCGAARTLVEIDGSYQVQVTEMLWQWAENVHLNIVERVQAVEVLTGIEFPRSTPRLTRLIIEAIRDPSIPGEMSARLVVKLPRAQRTSMEQFLLANEVMDLSHRFPRFDGWDDIPVKEQAEGVIRDLLAAPERSAEDRRSAATGLSRLRVRKNYEAIEMLLAEGSAVALVEAAKQGAAQFVHDRARAQVLNDTLPIRERRQAALMISKITDEPSVRDFLLSDIEAPWRVRIEELRCARRFDDLRAIRDDPSRSLIERAAVVEALLMHSTDDLRACAKVLAGIAADPVALPALRLRAAIRLSKLGLAGRRDALPLLEALAFDDELPVVTRSKAATAISSASPVRRLHIRALQLELLPLATPSQRVVVLDNLGVWWPEDSLPVLRAMATDLCHTGRVRLRAGITAVGLRRSERTLATTVAKELAYDQSVPRHVRKVAACVLAMWSVECREDARVLLGRLRGACPE